MKIVFATNNLDKIKEVQSLIPSHITLVSLNLLGVMKRFQKQKTQLKKMLFKKHRM